MAESRLIYSWPLTNALLEFWAASDFRKQNMSRMKGSTLDYVIRQITKRGKLLSNMIVNRQLKGIPAPDMFQGVSE